MKLFGHDGRSQAIFENELNALTRLARVARNDHLIKVKGTYSDRKHLVMLLEPVADTNFKDYLSRGFKSILTDKTEKRTFQTYFGCLANTIRYLHGPDVEILHKDIKPENVLLKGRHLILTDFGTAFDWSKTSQSMTHSNAKDPRTPRYQSPEVAHAGEFHRASDIWSLGVLYLEMITVLRGKELTEMDAFFKTQGSHQTAIYANLESAMNWFEVLRSSSEGSPLDNEPLVWVKKMLNRVRENRPSAEVLYEEIINFQDSSYCGKCCRDTDTDSDSETATQSEVDPFDELDRQEVEAADLMESTAQDPVEIYTGNVPQWPLAQSNMTKISPFPRHDSQQSDLRSLEPQSATNRSRQVSQPLDVIENPFKDESRPSELGLVPTVLTSSFTSAKKMAGKGSKSKGFPGRDNIIKWLASSSDRLKARSHRRDPKDLSLRPPFSTIESQRIGHFLSTLPEETADYEQLSPGRIPNQQPITPFGLPSRSFTTPTFNVPHVGRRAQSGRPHLLACPR